MDIKLMLELDYQGVDIHGPRFDAGIDIHGLKIVVTSLDIHGPITYY